MRVSVIYSNSAIANGIKPGEVYLHCLLFCRNSQDILWTNAPPLFFVRYFFLLLNFLVVHLSSAFLRFKSYEDLSLETLLLPSSLVGVSHFNLANEDRTNSRILGTASNSVSARETLQADIISDLTSTEF